ncbi:sensor histidine kinase [Streptosporangium sp. NPDC004631]
MNDHDPRPPVPRRPRHGRWVAVDVVAAILLTTGFGAALLVTGLSPVPAAAVCLPVAVRRLWPLPTLWAVLASATAALLTGWEEPYLVVAVVLYTVALLEPRRRAATALAVSLAVIAPALCLTTEPSSWTRALSATVFSWLLMGLSWTVGSAVREQRALAVHMAEQSAIRAVADERLRIARDLHDVVAHSMSLITLRAGVAGLVAETRPQEARAALRLIETTGRSALTEIRHMLGILRSDTDRPTLEPVPRLEDLSALGARAGVQVDLNVGVDAVLPDGVELTVYRIVQEALTNVVKHARSARCSVAVTSPEPGVVDVEVTDDGPGTPGGGRIPRGHGLTGMAERVMVYGGSFTAGPRSEGGFRVHARLPFEHGESR